MKPFICIALLLFPAWGIAQIIDPGLTAVYEHKQQLVKLKWHHNDNQVKKYILQRSTDSRQWSDIYSIQITEPEYYKFISFYDTRVSTGKSYYRLKSQLSGNTIEYSQPLMVIIGQQGNNWLMYPVPVKDVLNLQYNGNAIIPGVISVIIQRMNGQVYHQLRFASSTRHISIPVSNLGSGIYDVRIIVDKKVVWNQRFVK